MKLIQCMLATIIMLVTGSTVFAQKKLVLNGGFENELEGWVDYSAKAIPYMFSAGKMSAALFSSDPAKWTGMHQIVSLPKNTQYILMSAKIKVDGVSTGKDAWNGALFLFETLNKQETKIGEGINIASVTGDEDWKLYEKAYIIPPGVVKIKMLFALGYVTGTMFVDEVSLKVITQAEFEKYL